MIRTAAFFLFILVTWYLAGMYRYLVLLVLLGIEIIVLVGAGILSHYFRRALQVLFPVKSKTAVRGEQIDCPVESIYTGRLPVNRLLLKVELFYADDEKRRSTKVWGGCEKGKSEMAFSVSPSYCGILDIQLRMFRTYDYFSLCSAKKNLQERMRVLVFPRPLRLNFSLPFPGQTETGFPEEKVTDKRDGGNYEIRHIREYQPGDPIRHIHWNLSARTDSLWLKEFHQEKDSAVYVTLDLRGSENNPARRSSFYTLVYALTAGLQAYTLSVKIQWFDWTHKIWQNEETSNEEECRDILALLYSEKCIRLSGEERAETRPVPEKEDFRLNLDLELFKGNDQIYRFSQENLEEEIEKNVFII